MSHNLNTTTTQTTVACTVAGVTTNLPYRPRTYYAVTRKMVYREGKSADEVRQYWLDLAAKNLLGEVETLEETRAAQKRNRVYTATRVSKSGSTIDQTLAMLHTAAKSGLLAIDLLVSAFMEVEMKLAAEEWDAAIEEDKSRDASKRVKSYFAALTAAEKETKMAKARAKRERQYLAIAKTERKTANLLGKLAKLGVVLA